MANTTTKLKLRQVLEETKDPVALESAKLQLNAVEQEKPQQYQPSQAVQQAQTQLNVTEQKRPQQYQPSQAVTQAKQNLNDLAKPDAYQDRYDAQIQDVLNTIQNRGQYKYDVNNDLAYKTLRDQALRMGERSAADAAASAASMTGGYGSSYGAMAAQQAQQAYMANLNDQLPTLMEMDYAKYRDALTDDYNKLSALQSLEQTDYGKWRDLMGDYFTDRDYLSGRYDTEYAKDYQEYRDNVSDYNTELAYMYTKYNDMSADDYEKYRDNMDLWLQDRDYYLSKYGLAQDQANWQTQWDYEMSKSSGGRGGGGSGGGGKTVSGKQETAAQDDYTGNNRTAVLMKEPVITQPAVTTLKNIQDKQQDMGPVHYVAEDSMLTLKDLAKQGGLVQYMTPEEGLQEYQTYVAPSVQQGLSSMLLTEEELAKRKARYGNALG